MKNRETIDEQMIDLCLEALKLRIMKNIKKHGDGAFVSTHEGRGIIAEEVEELWNAMKSNNLVGINDECLDVAATAMFMFATVKLWQFKRYADEV